MNCSGIVGYAWYVVKAMGEGMDGWWYTGGDVDVNL
jgi:hypothetical protein